jgi:hypothetical protein
MKKIIIFILTVFSLNVACSTLPSIIYSFNERTYRPCGEQEFKNLFPESRPEHSTATFCFRYCAKYKLFRAHIGQNCVRWETDVQDLRNYETFKKFRDAGFILTRSQEVK